MGGPRIAEKYATSARGDVFPTGEDPVGETVQPLWQAFVLIEEILVFKMHFLVCCLPSFVLLGEISAPKFNGEIKAVVDRVCPDVVLLPYSDRHADHRLVFDAAMVATRPVGKTQSLKLVAAYETLSETHWNAPHIEPNFTPNCTIDVTDFIDTKLEAMSCYQSQLHAFPAPRSLEALKALALFRGSQAGMGYGEGLHILRMTAGLEVLTG